MTESVHVYGELRWWGRDMGSLFISSNRVEPSATASQIIVIIISMVNPTRRNLTSLLASWPRWSFSRIFFFLSESWMTTIRVSPCFRHLNIITSNSASSYFLNTIAMKNHKVCGFSKTRAGISATKKFVFFYVKFLLSFVWDERQKKYEHDKNDDWWISVWFHFWE